MTRMILFLTCPLLFTTAASIAAAEPTSEVPEATRQQVVRAIGDFVEQDIARKGKFLLLDPRTDKPLALAFDHVHESAKPKGDDYLACVDFKGSDGTVYDVDVVVDVSGHEPRVTTVLLHKVGGEKVTAQAQ